MDSDASLDDTARVQFLAHLRQRSPLGAVPCCARLRDHSQVGYVRQHVDELFRQSIDEEAVLRAPPDVEEWKDGDSPPVELPLCGNPRVTDDPLEQAGGLGLGLNAEVGRKRSDPGVIRSNGLRSVAGDGVVFHQLTDHGFAVRLGVEDASARVNGVLVLA